MLVQLMSCTHVPVISTTVGVVGDEQADATHDAAKNSLIRLIGLHQRPQRGKDEEGDC